MEAKRQQRPVPNFPRAMKYTEIFVLEIEDNYKFMDTELIEELESVIDPILDEFLENEEPS